MLTFDFPKEYLPWMQSLGADPKVLYNTREKFNIESAVLSFKSKIEHVKVPAIGEQRQLQSLERLLADPCRGHPLVVVNSLPSDTRAKLIGLNLMYRALKKNEMERTKNPRVPKVNPLWIPVYNQFFDIHKYKQQKPSMLILSNINIESTNQKLEKVRDILECYSDIPRYIITGGTDPFLLMYTKLFLSVNHVINLGSKNTVKSAMELLSI